MVGSFKVVVNSLGNSHYTTLITVFKHEFGNFIACIHRVVSAVVEEVADIVFFKNLKNTLVIGIVNFRILDFVAAGSERR